MYVIVPLSLSFQELVSFFDVFIIKDKDLEGIHKLQAKAVIAFLVECNVQSQGKTLNGPDLNGCALP